MSAEDKELMARISHLAGKINRHKNQQAGLGSRASGALHHTSHRTHHPRIDGSSGTGYANGWKGTHPYLGTYSGARPVHRNRSLILNGNSHQGNANNSDPGAASDASSSSSWITKNDRHLQLINSSVYDKESQARTKAIEQTRRHQQNLKDEQERIKLISHLNRVAASGPIGPPGHQHQRPSKYEVTVEGIKFAVTKNGSKLVRVPGPNNSAASTPKVATVGGVRFYRSKNGNLYRHGIVKAHRQSGAVKKVNIPCKNFSLTGSCLKGPQCRFVHDPDKVAICKDFLLHGECFDGDSCDLSHDPTPERTPACVHFARDSCNKSDCRYAHVKVSSGAPVCRSFGIYGYCAKGASCTGRHAFECPDFANTGVCRTKGCKLPHRERASALRKAKETSRDDDMEDFDSDAGSVDSDDVDSDEVDEFIGPDETNNADYVGMDFIEL
ncbi:hypothetical protein OQA88_5702 [Cercophora sp. LCS_1]